jgi:hypothetical protein
MSSRLFFSGAGLFSFATVIFYSYSISAQVSKQQKDSINEAKVKSWVESQHFQFIARFALPMGRASKSLTSEYSLSVKKEQVVAALPYYGQAYSANIGQGGGGIEFTSSVFDYATASEKKGGWDISIKPKDVKEDVYSLYLHISSTGIASLQVSSNNRQSISFSGFIKSLK